MEQMVPLLRALDLYCTAVKNILKGVLLQAQALSISNGTQGVHRVGCGKRRWEEATGKEKIFRLPISSSLQPPQ